MKRLVLAVVASLAIPCAAQERPSTISLSEGKFGKAAHARIAGVTVAGNPRFRQPPLTVECWARLLGKGSYNILVASDGKASALHWEIFSRAETGEFSAFLPGVQPAEVYSGVDICDGRWHYLAMTFDGGLVRLFIDGKQTAQKTVVTKTTLEPAAGPLTIGLVHFGKDNAERLVCNGLIDEVRVSQTIRTIKEVPQAPLPQDPATVALWRFDGENDDVDPAWTPRPIPSGVYAWQNETDKDWIDPRFQLMDTGPFLNATIAYPSWKGETLAYRGTAIRIGDNGEAAVLFDRDQLRFAAGWTGNYLEHRSRRFGLLNTPKPAGKIHFATNKGAGWTAPTHPLPEKWARFRGLYLHGKRTVLAYTLGDVEVLDSPWLEDAEAAVFSRTFNVSSATQDLQCLICDLPGAAMKSNAVDGWQVAQSTSNGQATAIALIGKGAALTAAGNRISLTIAPHREAIACKVLLWSGGEKELGTFTALLKTVAPPDDLRTWTNPGPTRWQEVITRGELGQEDGPFAIDTITVPYENPYKALMFLSGVDFLPKGDIAVCSAHGDVWLVRGVDEGLRRIEWKRFATGMYQPLGLKVVDGKIHIIERGQLTQLHDRNGDGEADFYENVNSDWHVAGGEHSFDTCLETDPQGNFYFFNTGDAETPTGGCLLRVSRDGQRCDVFSTGFRHPIGLGVSPTGIVTGADQQGNWMPATRIDQYHEGGFYGDMRTHHRQTPPKIYDPPLCWLPQHMDNSAGGQVWIPKDTFGPLAGQMLHLSYGRCRALLVMRQEVDGRAQGGAVDLGLQFLSGVARGRFHPNDGHLYLVGLEGWQTAALRDGCLQRVRYTGKKVLLPTGLTVLRDGIEIRFPEALDQKSAETNRFHIQQWNYRWSADYGSKQWSVRDANKIGADDVAIQAINMLPDNRGVVLRIAGLTPVMQMQIDYQLKTAAGENLTGTICNTIHRLGAR